MIDVRPGAAAGRCQALKPPVMPQEGMLLSTIQPFGCIWEHAAGACLLRAATSTMAAPQTVQLSAVSCCSCPKPGPQPHTHAQATDMASSVPVQVCCQDG